MEYKHTLFLSRYIVYSGTYLKCSSYLVLSLPDLLLICTPIFFSSFLYICFVLCDRQTVAFERLH